MTYLDMSNEKSYSFNQDYNYDIINDYISSKIILFKKFFDQLKKNLKSYSTKSNIDSEFKSYNDYVNLINKNLNLIAIKLNEFEFEKELMDFLEIKNMIEFILEDETKFNKYHDFVYDLICHFFDLIKNIANKNNDFDNVSFSNSNQIEFMINNDFNNYYEQFSKYLKEKIDFFNTEIYTCSPETLNLVKEFSKSVMR